MRAVGIKIKEKLGGVLANAQIADGLSVLGVEVLAYCGVADVVFLLVFIQAFGNNSWGKRSEECRSNERAREKERKRKKQRKRERERKKNAPKPVLSFSSIAF